ncbi:MAG TPA: hypothetical protein VEH07_07020, partial [Alphaproteobacteria bacterium]|nr:hypothetical protein [Alphaproteobacteria bacterium]
RSAANPNKVICWVPWRPNGSKFEKYQLRDSHPAFGKSPVDGKPTAYVCRGNVCSLPVTTAEELAALLVPPGLRSKS